MPSTFRLVTYLVFRRLLITHDTQLYDKVDSYTCVIVSGLFRLVVSKCRQYSPIEYSLIICREHLGGIRSWEKDKLLIFSSAWSRRDVNVQKSLTFHQPQAISDSIDKHCKTNVWSLGLLAKQLLLLRFPANRHPFPFRC